MSERPLFAFAADLSSYSETPPEWVHIMPLGHFAIGPSGADGPLDVTTETVPRIVQNFGDQVPGHDVSLDVNHEKTGPTPGWIRDLEARGDGLWARVEWTLLGTQLVDTKEYRYLSPEWFPEFSDPQDGAIHQDVLTGLSLTNRPYFRQLPPLSAEARDRIEVWPSASPAPSPTPLSADQWRVQLHSLTIAKLAATGLDYEQAVRAVLAERPDLLPPSASGQQAQQPVGQALLPAAFPSFEQRREELCALTAHRQAAEGTSFRDALRVVCAERPDLAAGPDRVLAPEAEASRAASEQLATLAQQRAKTGDGTFRDALCAVCAENPKLAEALHGVRRQAVSGPTSPVCGQEQASSELARLAQARVKASGIPFREALTAVAAENPALAAAYTGRGGGRDDV